MANEIQTVSLSPAPTGGTWSLTFDGETAAGLAYNIDAASLQSALEALSNIGAGNVAVSGTAPYTVTFQGDLGNTDVPTMTADTSGLTQSAGTITNAEVTPGATPVQEVQTLTYDSPASAGSWTAAGETLDFDATAAEVAAALETGLGVGVSVTGPGVGPFPVYTVTWDDAGPRSAIVTTSAMYGTAVTPSVGQTQTGVTGTAEVQTITFSATPASGTWSVNGQTVNWDASPEAAIETATGQSVTVTGDINSGWVVTWDAVGARALLTVADIDLLDGGASPVTPSAAETTPGVDPAVEIQTITFSIEPKAGTWSPNSQPLDWDATAAEVEAAVETATSQGVAVTGSHTVGYTVTWDAAGPRDPLVASDMGGGGAILSGGAAIPVNVAEQTPGVTGVAEVQSITLTDTPTSGTWKPQTGGSAVDWDATTAEVEAALEAALSLGVAVTGSDGGPYTVTWDVTGPQSMLVSEDVDLTKGGVTADVQVTQQGGPDASAVPDIFWAGGYGRMPGVVTVKSPYPPGP